jgi:hypothetical protein
MLPSIEATASRIELPAASRPLVLITCVSAPREPLVESSLILRVTQELPDEPRSRLPLNTDGARPTGYLTA